MLFFEIFLMKKIPMALGYSSIRVPTRYPESMQTRSYAHNNVHWKTIGLGDMIYIKNALFYVLSVSMNDVIPTDEYYGRLCGPITDKNIGACRKFVSGTITNPSNTILNDILGWQNITSDAEDDDTFVNDSPSLLRFTTIIVEPDTNMYIEDVSDEYPSDYLDILQWYGKGFSGNVYHTRLQSDGSPGYYCYPATNQDIFQQLSSILVSNPSISSYVSFSSVRPGDLLIYNSSQYFVFDTLTIRLGVQQSIGIVCSDITPSTTSLLCTNRVMGHRISPLPLYLIEEYSQRIVPYPISTHSVTPNFTGRSLQLENGSLCIIRPDIFDRLSYIGK
jgi:hypothetical protein